MNIKLVMIGGKMLEFEFDSYVGLINFIKISQLRGKWEIDFKWIKLFGLKLKFLKVNLIHGLRVY